MFAAKSKSIKAWVSLLFTKHNPESGCDFYHSAYSGWLQILFDSAHTAVVAAAALKENSPLGPTWSRRARMRRSSGCSSGTWPDLAWRPYSTHFLSSGQVRVFSHFTLRASRCFWFLFFFSPLEKVRVLKLKTQICSVPALATHPALLRVLVDVSGETKVFRKVLELLSDVLALLRAVVSPHELWEECSITANELASVLHLFLYYRRHK